MVANFRKEFERIERVLKISITGHSYLRDKYQSLSNAVDLLLILSAIILNALVFADFSNFQIHQFIENEIDLLLGIFSIIVFMSSIINIIVNWKQKSENHKQSAIKLYELLSEHRLISSLPGNPRKDGEIKKYIESYANNSRTIYPIPEKKFNKIKSKHFRKVQISKVISKNPGIPRIIASLIVFYNSIVHYNEV